MAMSSAPPSGPITLSALDGADPVFAGPDHAGLCDIAECGPSQSGSSFPIVKTLSVGDDGK